MNLLKCPIVPADNFTDFHKSETEYSTLTVGHYNSPVLVLQADMIRIKSSLHNYLALLVERFQSRCI